jgi:thiol-disulfide isomerase/thioredoxin
MNIGALKSANYVRAVRWLLLSAVAACGQQDAAVNASHARDQLPVIRLQGIDRADSDSAAFRGTVRVINVWATWCPPCRREMPSLERLHARLDPARARLIGLSVENDQHQVREWLRKSNISFPNYLDTGTPRARELLQISSFPQTFLVSPDGRVMERIEGARDWADPKWAMRINDVSREWERVQK